MSSSSRRDHTHTHTHTYIYIYIYINGLSVHFHVCLVIAPDCISPLLKARKIAIKPLIDASPKIENRAAVKEVKHR